jgi:hypothetical protein
MFAIIYYYIAEHFQSDNGNKNKEQYNFYDFLLLSTTIQAGVGISELTPSTFYSKIILIVQQILLIFTHLITLYIFTL